MWKKWLLIHSSCAQWITRCFSAVHVVGDTGKYKLNLISRTVNQTFERNFWSISLNMEKRKKWSEILLCLLQVLQSVPIQRQLWSPFGARNLLEHLNRCVVVPSTHRLCCNSVYLGKCSCHSLIRCKCLCKASRPMPR